MQKLSGISSGQNNKSCRIIHQEPKKTGFAFFRFFYDFIRNLQESGKLQILLKFYFCAEAPEKNRPFAMWPLGGRPAAVRPNSGQPPAGAGRARAGEDPWVLGDRFPGSVAAGKGLARGGAGGQARWPRLPEFLRRGLDAGGVGRLRSFGGCKGRWGAARFGTQPAGACSSPWRARWRAGRAAWHDAGAGARLGSMQRGAAPLYGGQESTVTSLGVNAGLGRSERQWRQGMDRWSVGIPGRTERGARRGWTPRRPRWAHGLGKSGLRTREGPDAKARYGARERGAGARGAARRRSAWKNYAVPLFERVKLQKVE
jgi:hypothetical protein